MIVLLAGCALSLKQHSPLKLRSPLKTHGALKHHAPLARSSPVMRDLGDRGYGSSGGGDSSGGTGDDSSGDDSSGGTGDDSSGDDSSGDNSGWGGTGDDSSGGLVQEEEVVQLDDLQAYTTEEEAEVQADVDYGVGSPALFDNFLELTDAEVEDVRVIIVDPLYQPSQADWEAASSYLIVIANLLQSFIDSATTLYQMSQNSAYLDTIANANSQLSTVQSMQAIAASHLTGTRRNVNK